MKYVPHPYQAAMQHHTFEHERCALWAGMGLGKTVTVASAIALENELVEDGRTLVLAPLRVAQSTWPDEVEKWDHLSAAFRCSPVIGGPEERRRALAADANLFTMNYDNIPWLVEQYRGKKWPFLRVVADEATRLKGFRLRMGGVRAQALGKIAHRGPKQWINLTGTPAPNGLMDLWGQTWFLDAGKRLGYTFTAFKDRWFQLQRNGFDYKPMPFAQEAIQDSLRDLCMSVRGEDVFPTDAIVVNNIYVDLPKKAMVAYKEMEKELFTMIDGREVEALTAAAKSIKCLQMANGAVYLNPDEENLARREKEWRPIHDAKLDALDSVIQEAAGMPVLVAYQFKPDLARILKAFPKARELDKNPQTLRDWNAGLIPILVGHPQSAGHGLNLQDGGNIICFFGHWWSLENYLQIIERIGPVRQAQAGHPRPVFLHNIIARDTVDELVLVSRETKRSVNDVLMEAARKHRTKH